MSVHPQAYRPFWWPTINEHNFCNLTIVPFHVASPRCLSSTVNYPSFLCQFLDQTPLLQKHDVWHSVTHGYLHTSSLPYSTGTLMSASNRLGPFAALFDGVDPSPMRASLANQPHLSPIDSNHWWHPLNFLQIGSLMSTIAAIYPYNVVFYHSAKPPPTTQSRATHYQ